MDDWEQFGGSENSIDFQVGGVKIFALLDGLLVEVALDEALVEVLVEAVDFVAWILDLLGQLLFGEPLNVQVAPVFKFDQVFVSGGTLPLPLPDDVGDLQIEDALLIVILGGIIQSVILLRLGEPRGVLVPFQDLVLVVGDFLGLWVNFAPGEAPLLRGLGLAIDGLVVPEVIFKLRKRKWLKLASSREAPLEKIYCRFFPFSEFPLSTQNNHNKAILTSGA